MYFAMQAEATLGLLAAYNALLWWCCGLASQCFQSFSFAAPFARIGLFRLFSDL